MRPWFDESGLLKLDEYVCESASFRKIMEDGVVTGQEVADHAGSVAARLRTLEAALPDGLREDVLDVLCELAVLYAIQRTHALQTSLWDSRGESR